MRLAALSRFHDIFFLRSHRRERHREREIGKREEGRGKREEGRWKMEDGRWKMKALGYLPAKHHDEQ